MRASSTLLVASLVGAIGLAGCGGGARSQPDGISSECAGCHGDGSRAGTPLQQAAPPSDARGRSAVTELTVGAHQAHVYGGVDCATCHVVPRPGDWTHVRGRHAPVIFSGNVVGAQGATVAPWSRDQPTCANYCHGDFKNGNRARPVWNSGVAATCNSCHGSGAGAAATPPVGVHPQGALDCSTCHAGYTTTTVNAATHVNGRVDLAGVFTCTSCHGDPARPGTALEQAAPPVDARGHTATNEVTVGAHQAHLSRGVACTTCHTVPPDGDRTHAAEPYATVTFSGNLVGANGTPVAPWNRDQPTCANYCHNVGRGAGIPTPSWTRSAPLGCGACHSDQQSASASGLHQLHVTVQAPAPQLDCGACHGTGYSKTGVTGAAQATHLDASIQILPLVGWEDPRCNGPRTCYASCHAVQACKYWP